MTEEQAFIEVYDTPQQGKGIIVGKGRRGFRVCGPNVYGQQTTIIKCLIDERARKKILKFLTSEDQP